MIFPASSVSIDQPSGVIDRLYLYQDSDPNYIATYLTPVVHYTDR